MYVPILKNRSTELDFIQNYNSLFSEKVIPLIEIINNIYEPKFKTDPSTGGYIYQMKPFGKKKTRIRLSESDNDIITLPTISKILNGHKAFIDFFRFDISEYKKFDPNKVKLSLKLSKSSAEYIDHIKVSATYDNFIPVISLKEKCFLSSSELEELVTELQKKKDSIAIRITFDTFDKYSKIIIRLLRKSDYLMYDIREQQLASMRVEIMKFNKYTIAANKILLNSPRPHDVKNGQFEKHGKTVFINNSVLKEHVTFGFNGFGDFGGLRDELPDKTGGNGTGAACALLFQYSDNAFFSYVNPDTSLGATGYKTLIPVILSERPVLDSAKVCPAYGKILMLPGGGSFASWIYITLIRYVSQINRYYK